MGIALFVFDRVAVSRRGTQPVTIILIGFACGALPGPITTAVVGFPLFRALFSTLTGVVDSGMGTFIGMDAVAVAAALLIGLCIVAASVPTIATDGLWSRAGAILTAAIVAAELIILCAELFRF